MSIVRKMQCSDGHGRPASLCATVAALLTTACFGGCATPPPNAWVTAQEQFGSARTPSAADNVEVVGSGFTPYGPVVLRVADLPNYTQDIVYTVPGTAPTADSGGVIDHGFTPPCFYSVGNYPLISRPVRLLATDEAGWTVYADTLTAQSFSCDSPPAAGH